MEDKTLKDRIEAELQSLTEKNGGILKCEDVVAFARDEKTALHSQFTWDDTDAAREYRLWQARRVIKQFYIVIEPVGRPVQIRQWCSVPSDRAKQGGGYRDTKEVMKNPDMRAEVEREALGKLRRITDEYTAIKSLDPIRQAIAKRQMELDFSAQTSAVAV